MQVKGFFAPSKQQRQLLNLSLCLGHSIWIYLAHNSQIKWCQRQNSMEVLKTQQVHHVQRVYAMHMAETSTTKVASTMLDQVMGEGAPDGGGDDEGAWAGAMPGPMPPLGAGAGTVP